jgi:hypothetical protein
VSFERKRPMTGKKPMPIEEMSRFIKGINIRINYFIEGSENLKASKIQKNIQEKQEVMKNVNKVRRMRKDSTF